MPDINFTSVNMVCIFILWPDTVIIIGMYTIWVPGKYVCPFMLKEIVWYYIILNIFCEKERPLAPGIIIIKDSTLAIIKPVFWFSG